MASPLTMELSLLGLMIFFKIGNDHLTGRTKETVGPEMWAQMSPYTVVKLC